MCTRGAGSWGWASLPGIGNFTEKKRRGPAFLNWRARGLSLMVQYPMSKTGSSVRLARQGSLAGGREMSMPLLFSPVTLDRAAEYGELYSRSPRKSAWYTIGSLWAWRRVLGLEWAFDDGMCWIRSDGRTLWAPVGDWRDTDWGELLRRRFPEGVAFDYVPDALCSLLKELPDGRVETREDRTQWEYIHSVRELAELRGNRFLQKRSHFNQFVRKYRYNYRSLSGEEIGAVVEGQDLWIREQPPSPSLEREDRAVRELAAGCAGIPGLLGGMIEVDGMIIAYTVGEAVGDDTIVIHFEKALRRFKGAYQAINRLFLRNTAHSFSFVNREEDMGDEGMRVAKMSYHPVDFLKKCFLSWIPD